MNLIVVRNVALFVAALGSLCGCGKSKTTAAAPREIRSIYPSARILIEGEDKAKVIARWGKPERIYKRKLEEDDDEIFRGLSLVPPHNEVWVYSIRSGIRDRGVFFQNGVVVYCLEDGGDF